MIESTNWKQYLLKISDLLHFNKALLQNKYKNMFTPIKSSKTQQASLTDTHTRQSSDVLQKIYPIETIHHKIQKKRIFSQKMISLNIKKMNMLFKQPVQIDYLLNEKLKSDKETCEEIQQKRKKNSSIKAFIKINTLLNKQKDQLFGIRFKHQNQLHRTKDILSERKQSIIGQINNLRKSQNLYGGPKQWHFHNCLKLQQIQLYHTNLKISCQGWTLIDLLQMKFLRGWNPKTVNQYTPALRLFIFQIWNELISQGKILKQTTFQVNTDLANKVPIEKRFLSNNTILYIKDLVVGCLITHYQDLIQYATTVLGKILGNSEQQITKVYIHSNKHQMKHSRQCFQQKCQQICENYNLKQIKVIYNPKNQEKHFQLLSSSLDIAIFFMYLLKSQYFKNCISKLNCLIDIKFQVGYNYWEDRRIKFINQNYFGQNWLGIRGKCMQSKNQCVVAIQTVNNVIVTMLDCKVNMPSCDIQQIQRWYKSKFQRFKDKKSKPKQPCCLKRLRFKTEN